MAEESAEEFLSRPDVKEAIRLRFKEAMRMAYLRGWTDGLIAVYKESLGESWTPLFEDILRRSMRQNDDSNTDSEEKSKK